MLKKGCKMGPSVSVEYFGVLMHPMDGFCFFLQIFNSLSAMDGRDRPLEN
jgi:hypothetical protein